MSKFYKSQQYALPYGYDNNSNTITLDPRYQQTNAQLFMAEAQPAKYVPQEVQQEVSRIIRPRIFDQAIRSPVKRAISCPKLQQSRTIKKRAKIFDVEVSYNPILQTSKVDQTFDLKDHTMKDYNMKDQLLQQIEQCKVKAHLYSDTYPRLLQRLINLVEQGQHSNLLFSKQFSEIVFEIRTFDGLDLQDRVELEKIINNLSHMSDKLEFQEIVKEIFPTNWMNWIEPLYYQCNKENISKQQWRSYIYSKQQ